MRLLALSDLHVGHAGNRAALEALPPHPADWLLVPGDVGETPAHLAWALSRLRDRFAQVVWTPGNHELWTHPVDPCQLRGEERYEALVALCRELGVLTPEDPFPTWPGPRPEGVPPLVIVPLFVGYDYTFGGQPTPQAAVAWAREEGLLCADEHWLHPDPHTDRAAWCRARVALSEARLAAIPADRATVLLAHWPLREDLVRLRRIPRFVIWCGTRATEHWHRRFRAHVVVTGHLHVRTTDWRDGVRFEEVAVGYPRQQAPGKPWEAYLREIAPGVPVAQPAGREEPEPARHP